MVFLSKFNYSGAKWDLNDSAVPTFWTVVSALERYRDSGPPTSCLRYFFDPYQNLFIIFDSHKDSCRRMWKKDNLVSKRMNCSLGLFYQS